MKISFHQAYNYNYPIWSRPQDPWIIIERNYRKDTLLGLLNKKKGTNINANIFLAVDL